MGEEWEKEREKECADRESLGFTHPGRRCTGWAADKSRLACSKHSLSRKNTLGQPEKPQDCETPFSERLKLCTALCGPTRGMNLLEHVQEKTQPKLIHDAGLHFFLPVLWRSSNTASFYCLTKEVHLLNVPGQKAQLSLCLIHSIDII